MREAGEVVTLRLVPAEGGIEADAVRAMLRAHAVPGTERHDPVSGVHERLIGTSRGPVAVAVALRVDAVEVTTRETRPGVLAELEGRVRRWLDLDAPVATISAALAAHPRLAPLVAARPQLRVTGYPDAFEAAAVTVLGQQVSIAAARTFAGRLVAGWGEPVGDLVAFPSPEAVAAAEPLELQAAVRITHGRTRTLQGVARAMADGLDLDGDPAAVRAALLALPGIGAWSADYLEVRAMGRPDVFVPGDLVARRMLGVRTPREAAETAAAWAPWRSYALFHLWAPGYP